MTATDPGGVTAWALDGLADRGYMFVEPTDQVYAGQVVGEHCKEGDIPVNAVKQKPLTNMRAASKDRLVVPAGEAGNTRLSEDSSQQATL